MNEKFNSNKSLELAIVDSGLAGLTKDYAELAIDGLLKDGIFKDIPILGSVIGTIRFGSSINKHIATKKLYKFLFQLHKIPFEKRKAKIDQINSSKKYQSSVGEQLFELLDRIESDGKPEILGKLLAAVIEEKINYQTFLKASHIVKTVFYYDLLELKVSYNGKHLNQSVNDFLMINGLINYNADPLGAYKAALDSEEGENSVGEEYIQERNTLTEMGKLIIEIGMK